MICITESNLAISILYISQPFSLLREKTENLNVLLYYITPYENSGASWNSLLNQPLNSEPKYPKKSLCYSKIPNWMTLQALWNTTDAKYQFLVGQHLSKYDLPKMRNCTLKRHWYLHVKSGDRGVDHFIVSIGIQKLTNFEMKSITWASVILLPGFLTTKAMGICPASSSGYLLPR